MPLDGYSLCPCGSGKKLKFCCGDIVHEIEKIDRMMDGQQYVACLAFIEGLEEKHPHRPILVHRKAMLQFQLGRVEASRQTVDKQLAAVPKDAGAVLLKSLHLAVEGDSKAAILTLQDALELAAGQPLEYIYDVIVTLGAILLDQDEYIAALMYLAAVAHEGNEDPRMSPLIGELTSSPQINTFFRQQRRLAGVEENLPFKAELDAAVLQGLHLEFHQAAEKLAKLAETHKHPVIYYDLAIAEACSLEREKAAVALRQLADLPGTSLVEAVECEAFAQLLTEEGLGAQVDRVRYTYVIHDAEQAKTTCLSEKRLIAEPVDTRTWTEQELIPPEATFLFTSCAVPDSAEGLALKDLPFVLGSCHLYGKRTDHPARLEIFSVKKPAVEAGIQWLLGVLGEVVGEKESEEVVEQIPAYHDLISTVIVPPKGITPEQFRDMSMQLVEHQMLELWPAIGDPRFDGATPAEAAQKPEWQRKVLAAVLVLESADFIELATFDFDRLRAKLGLPVLGMLPAEMVTRDAPSVRFMHIDPKSASDDQLRIMASRILNTPFRRNAAPILREAAGRKLFPEPQQRLRLYRLLVSTCATIAETLACLDEARAATVDLPQVKPLWDLQEFDLCMQTGDGVRGQNILRRLMTEHPNHPAVQDLIQRLQAYSQMGRRGGAMPTGAGPAGPAVAPAPAAASEPKVWLPGSEPAEPKKESKLWLPGMD